jgi:hypothetical protein
MISQTIFGGCEHQAFRDSVRGFIDRENPAETDVAPHAVPGFHECAMFSVDDDQCGEALIAVIKPQSRG